jgi:drug/metabolite transporter (DMT)-like permease
MYKGIVFALAACFIWGLIFIVPLFMDGFSAIEVALGRFSFYGTVSVLILLKAQLQNSGRYPLSIWVKAAFFSLLTTIGYYTFLVLGLRYATPAICALILGISPITIAFYGNWKQRECSFKSLILPSVLIFIGLVIINTPHILESESPSTFALGLLFVLAALLIWSWFVVANSRFLKDHPEIKSSDWATLIGVASLGWALLFGLALTLHGDFIQLDKYTTWNPALMKYLAGSAVLGLLCSWVGGYLWNRASLYLPVSLAGQLTIFETIFGLLYVCLLDKRIPPSFECIGIALLLIAIFYGIRIFRVHGEEVRMKDEG